MQSAPEEELSEDTFCKFVALTHKLTGITISPTRKSMLQGRVQRRMRALKLSNYDSYLEKLESLPGELQQFIDIITTNETYFYRTPRIWQFLANEYLAEWHRNNPDGIFQAWSAAASSGEEASTLAMVLQQFCELHASFKYKILGTDISQTILDKAIRGSYSGRPIELLQRSNPDVIRKYMKKEADDSYSVIPAIRARISFQRHNLFEKPAFKDKFDLVLIRNVLIYFGATDQERVLSNISGAMKDEALLIIGESESLNRLKTPFMFKMPFIYTLPTNRTKAGGAA